MPRTTISTENASNEGADAEKLKLEKNGRARICVPEEPWGEWVHELRKPKIVDGHGVREARNNGGESWAMDYVGNHICLGNADQMNAQLKDNPDSPVYMSSVCPECAAAQRGEMIPAAKRRFAGNVIQYGLQPGSFQLSTPFSAKVIAWTLTEKRFGKLATLAAEHCTEPGDKLRFRDLLLGPCEDKTYQKYDIQMGGKAAWMYNDATKAFMGQLWGDPANRASDAALKKLCGRQTPRQYMEEDLQEVLRCWRIVNRGTAQADAEAGAAVFGGQGAPTTPDLAHGLDGLVPGSAPVSPTSTVAPVGVDPFGAPVQAETNPGVGGMEEFAPAAAQGADPFGGASPAPQSAPAPTTAASPAPQPAPQQTQGEDPFAGGAAPGGSAAGATTTGTAAPAAAQTSPTAPSAAQPAQGSDPFGDAGTAPAPAASSAPAATPAVPEGAPRSDADPFGGAPAATAAASPNGAAPQAGASSPAPASSSAAPGAGAQPGSTDDFDKFFAGI